VSASFDRAGDGVVLRVESLSKRYGELQVLDRISFGVRRGETKVVVGSSGAGKSTLLRCINRLTVPDEGAVLLDGEHVSAANATVMRQKMGFVFQDFNLFDHLSALRNVEIGLVRVKGMHRAAARERAMAELTRVGLAEKATSYPAELSGGQKQRVSIARSLAMDPDLMLFDEPTSALDPELIGEVLKVMKVLSDSGMTMIVVTHEMGFARSVADEMIFLDEGAILEQGKPHELFEGAQKERTRRFFEKINELY
jgi:polar amino acid transport system ATP-binding protein